MLVYFNFLSPNNSHFIRKEKQHNKDKVRYSIGSVVHQDLYFISEKLQFKWHCVVRESGLNPKDCGGLQISKQQQKRTLFLVCYIPPSYFDLDFSRFWLNLLHNAEISDSSTRWSYNRARYPPPITKPCVLLRQRTEIMFILDCSWKNQVNIQLNILLHYILFNLPSNLSCMPTYYECVWD